MSEDTIQEEAVVSDAAAVADDAADEALLEDLLVEDVSIDGMCGVY